MKSSLQIQDLTRGFADGTLDPASVLERIQARSALLASRSIFIEQVPLAAQLEALEQARARRERGERLPLFGIPFSVKDNIDVAGVPTTAACPAYRYVPTQSAPAVQRLVDQGAIVVGKTNLDQFATGLVGVRSPYGVCRSALDERYIAGGSSSGSALAVAHGLSSFALGTDTAGSGRVPAGFNNIVGLKPTRGVVSTSGVVPACRSLDCVSLFALSVRDAWLAFASISGFDPSCAYSRPAPPAALGSPFGPGLERPRLAVARELEFFGNDEYRQAYERTCDALVALGATLIPIDIAPLLEAGGLLYGGPWVAERLADVGSFIETHPGEVNEAVASIILDGKKASAAELFRAQHRLAELRRASELLLRDVDALLLPTTGTTYRVDDVLGDPLRLNANLGRYTNFVNLLDLAALALPGGFTSAGLPFGVTLLGPAFSDGKLATLGERLQRSLNLELGATGEKLTSVAAEVTPEGGDQQVLLAVCGAHLSGMPLNHELSSRGALLVKKCRTAADYELYALAGTTPPKPGLVRKPGFVGPGIEVEVWALDHAAFGSFVQGVPAPMVIGTALLDDGSRVKSFLCEPYALAGSPDITSHGGWRAFVKSRA